MLSIFCQQFSEKFKVKLINLVNSAKNCGDFGVLYWDFYNIIKKRLGCDGLCLTVYGQE